VDNAKAAATVRSVRLSLQILSLALAAWLVLEQKLSSGGIVAASIIGARAVGPIESCITGWRRFLAARLSLQTLEELAFAADRLEAHRLTLPAPSGAIAMQGVSLVEPDRRAAILSNISFASPAGAFIGVVGRSGSGKSSLLNLLAGAMRPSAGSIRIDGADLDQWRREALGPSIGFLPQSILLHRGTVAENIRRFGEPDDEGVIRAAKLCGAHAMILNLPFGYDTEIGDEGGALSGGQKQRLALARAVYGDPAILLLDEPTAALDGESEEQFWSMIQTLRAAGKTIYLVTHRAGHVQQADFVLVMAEGRVAQFGPAASVLPQLIPAPGGRRAS
jgi:ABC-type protease/lipase transport system fused ATPase/permease subunit